MTTLKDRLIAMIQASGPISVATYMDLCLHDRQHGYYATRPGLGTDFITAPEISQVFGELLGLWAAHEWQQMGAPAQITLVEIGPGRGTLMGDALRAGSTVPGFRDAAQLHFIEPSPVLRANLSETFANQSPAFLDQLSDVPTDHPILVLANEWLDCLPVQQYVRVGEAWHERVIGLTEDGALCFGLSEDAAPPGVSFPEAQAAAELQPGLKTVAETLRGVFSETPGRALFIDYGPADSTPQDSLRAYQAGVQIDPLEAPGETDLTCDVDVSRLCRLAKAQGLLVQGPVSQSQFLLSLGAEARLNQLVKSQPKQADALYESVRKLVDPADMGVRFQVVCLSSENEMPAAAF